MRFNSVQSRIIVLFLLLILGVQLLGFTAIRGSITSGARDSLQEQLDIGERVFRSLLEQHAKTLVQTASILAADYGFRQSITTNDQETIVSALSNHRGRVGAKLAILYSADGTLLAGDADTQDVITDRRLADLVEVAIRNGHSEGLTVLDNKPYQMVVVPVKAPLIVGWVAMGFEIDLEFVGQLKSLTLLDVTFMVSQGQDRWQATSSTFDHQALQVLTNAINSGSVQAHRRSEVEINDTPYSTRALILSDNSDSIKTLVILQRSIDDAIAPYLRLQWQLLILTILGAMVFVAGSIFAARRITRPLSDLSEKAKLLETGNYSVPIQIQLNDEVGRLGNALESMRLAIAEREQNISKLAYWDTLTGLPNRFYFQEKLAALITEATGSLKPSFSLLILNLDRFKQINNVMGHQFGDQLLISVSQRLSTLCLREHDILSRLSGDTFALYLHDADSGHASTIAKGLLQSLETPFEIFGQKVDISAGIGIASYPEHSTDAALLVNRAETAMYVAKSRHAGAVIYTSQYDLSSQESLTLMSELREAILRNELKLYLQPKIALDTGAVMDAEALIRWIHPRHGFMPPDRFIPFAEQTGIIQLISIWMIQQVCAWQAKRPLKDHHVKIGINLSAKDLTDIDLPDKIREILEHTGTHTHQLAFEITESAIMDDPQRAQIIVERLHEMGLTLAIDDFGTGYSSLAYLKRLPVDELKIDKSFVMNMENDDNDAMIVKSIINLGHELKLKVVAEGIENQTVLQLLQEMRCDFAQGYYYSKPMPAEQFDDWLEQFNSTLLPTA